MIVEVNNFIVEIDNEVNIIYKYVWDFYVKCFLELELFVFNVLDYICIVELLGNDFEVLKVDLIDIFLLVIKMVVSVIVLMI